MSRNHPLSLAAKVQVASLVAACTGFIIQFMAGVDDYPTIPPGVIVLLVAALAIVLLHGTRVPPMVATARRESTP